MKTPAYSLTHVVGQTCRSAWRRSSVALPLLLAAALFFPTTGCKIITGSDGTKQTVVDADKVAQIAGTAAALGTWVYLKQHPETRPAFAASVQAINALIGGTNYDAVAFAKALEGLPIKQFSGTDGTMYVTVAIEVFNAATAVATPIVQKELVQKTMLTVRDGIVRGMRTDTAWMTKEEKKFVVRKSWEDWSYRQMAKALAGELPLP